MFLHNRMFLQSDNDGLVFTYHHAVVPPGKMQQVFPMMEGSRGHANGSYTLDAKTFFYVSN